LVIDRVDSFSIPSFPSPPEGSSESRVALFLLNSGDVIHVSGGDDFTLGRSTKGQTIIPDIDLNPYNAYESGVSRLHANLNITGSEVFIHDLGSANGTRLNGKRIDSHIEYPVKNGDILGFGQLKIQVLVKQKTGELQHGN
jgi:pSer/pThr/pTyr-binding forkhead associated (FHA) protein